MNPLPIWHDRYFLGALLVPIPFWIWFHAHNIQPASDNWTLIILAPLLEEIAFRGTIQTLLMNSVLGRVHYYGLISGANLLSAFLFAVAHVVARNNLWGLATLFPGLIFGFFRERYQQLLPAIILHGYYNAGLL